MVLVASTIQVTALTHGRHRFLRRAVAGDGRRGARFAGQSRRISHDQTFLLADGETRDQVGGRAQKQDHRHHRHRLFYGYARAFVLTKNGLTPDREVALIGTGTTSNILTAMKAGTVDAGVLSPPFNAMATQMGYRTLAYFGDYVEQSLSGLGTSDKMIRDRPELVRRMLTATIKSLRFIQQRPAESMQFIGKEWSVDSASANELYKSMLPAFSKDGGMDEKGIRDALKRETERMALKEETPLSRVLDLRLLREVQKDFK